MPFDEPGKSDLDGLRLRAHAASAVAACGASLAGAALLLWAVLAATPQARLLPWMLALVATLAWRIALRRAQRLATPLLTDPDPVRRQAAQAVWLRRYRLAIATHGLVWGLAAWLPLSLVEPLQASVTLLLIGMVVGAMTVVLFDLKAALLFAGPALLPLLLRLLGAEAPLSPTTSMALAMGGLLIAGLVVASQRAAQERQRLAAARRAESDSAQGARDLQALLQQVFDHAGQGISVFDRDQRLLAWNNHVADLTGLAPEDLRPGVSLAACVRQLTERGVYGPDADTGGMAERLRLLGLPEPGVLRLRRPDGRLIEVRRNPLPDGGLLLIHVDITEREARRRAADEQQRMLALVLERTAQGFWYIDNDQRTTDANPAMCRMLGLTREQLLGRSIYEFVDAENRRILEHHVARRAAGEADGYELALTRSDGQQVHCFNNATPVLDASGRKTGALGLLSDISVQKAAQQQARQASEALAQKSKVLALTLDSLVQGVLNVDSDGVCTAWNRRFLALLQVPAALMSGRPTLNALLEWQLMQGEFGNQLEQVDEVGRLALVQAQYGLPPNSGHRYRRTRADGTVLEVASHFAADGSLVRTFTDVTASVADQAALVAARDEAERAREQAEAASRAKSDFLSRMSHELRTPLHAILGFAQLLQADPDEPPRAGQRQRLEALVRGGQHLLLLINDVLDVARIEGGHLQLSPEPVDLGHLLRDSLALVQPVAQARGVQLVAPTDLPTDGPWVVADATRLRQVLLNLLSNAIKFNRAAGTVQLQLHAGDDQVTLEVADQGAGIAPEQLPRLFQPFERLDMDGAVEGSGIGLALSRSLVTLMHGSIGVRSTPGQGSVFWVQLPACAAAPQLLDPPAAPVLPATAAAPLHDVLYIEDNEVNQILMQGMLAHRPGIALRLASLPEVGIEMALDQTPDLVLLDIQLPGIDGFEVLRRLRQQAALRHTPVVAVSANAMPDDLLQARAAGFADYLTKPLDMARLLAVVDQSLA